MIGTLDIELSAHDPQRPIRAISAHVGSPTSVRIRNVPRRVGEWRITSVRVSATYPDGTTVEADAVPTGGVYVATIEGCETAGTSRNGFAVKADGIDENGATVSDYTLGRGDVFILSDDGRQLPQTPITAVNILPSRPTVPHIGDAVWADGGALEIWDGHDWRSPAPGGGAVDSVNGQTGAVVLTGADIATSEADTQTVADKLSAKQDALTDDQKAVLNGGPYLSKFKGRGIESATLGEYNEETGESFDGILYVTDIDTNTTVIKGNSISVGSGIGDTPASIKKNRKEVATEDQLRVTMLLIGNDPYTVKLDGEELTFAQIKELAQTRNAVIQRGQGTYRVTYIGATEMMWDVTGTVAGNVQTGQIHIFYQDGDTVVQRVEPKVLATKPMIDEIKDTVSTDNRIIVNDTTAAIQTRTDETAEWTNEIRVDKGYDALRGSTMVKLDKSVQTVTVAGSNLVIEIPDSVDGTVRDLCVYANNSSDADTALTFPAGTYYGDDPNGAVAKAGKVTAIYLTEIPTGVWMLRITELEQHEVTA